MLKHNLDLDGNSLGAYDRHLAGHLANRPLRVGFQIKAENRGESYAAQHPQLVLGQSLARLADRPQQAGPKVLLTPDIVDDLVGQRIEEHAVDGKIAAASVFLR